jgi:hypothetical protein
MHEKDFRGVLFVLLLAFGGFCGMLFTVTVFAPEPGGIGLAFRLVVCVALAVAFLALLALDLYAIWTGHLPNQQKHQLN